MKIFLKYFKIKSIALYRYSIYLTNLLTCYYILLSFRVSKIEKSYLLGRILVT